eukprot:CAMPEP_0196742498 /NCGR_PEP_ID=MMETSP1091-20130531/47286_1 /TAXON_ID=302021 /ORGANISM="Rhodomonas sp., Strain CCMP768" /LENGTH=132 /DNA_ID=CAMNT_0042088573 /DNA_START=83 /DNA_END=481 /DNA_ORIENTATION=+
MTGCECNVIQPDFARELALPLLPIPGCSTSSGMMVRNVAITLSDVHGVNHDLVLSTAFVPPVSRCEYRKVYLGMAFLETYGAITSKSSTIVTTQSGIAIVLPSSEQLGEDPAVPSGVFFVGDRVQWPARPTE